MNLALGVLKVPSSIWRKRGKRLKIEPWGHTYSEGVGGRRAGLMKEERRYRARA